MLTGANLSPLQSTLIFSAVVTFSSAAYPVSAPNSPQLFVNGIGAESTKLTLPIAKNRKWEPIPITTAAQNTAGIAGGEGMQQIISLAYAPSMPNIVYMGADTSQIWKSLDSGRTWHAKSKGFFTNGARSLFVHPRNPNTVLAAGFMGKPVERKINGAVQGIFRSDNGGDSWKLVMQADFFKQGTTGSLFATDSRTLNRPALRVYVGTYDKGLYASENEGLTWSFARFNEGHISDIEELPVTPGTLLLATDAGLFRYRDGIYSKVGTGLPSPAISIAISPANPEVVHAVIGDNNFYRSTDSGESFARYSTINLGAMVADITISPLEPNILYAGTNYGKYIGPYYSHDGGKVWQRRKSINSLKLTAARGFYFASPIIPHPQKPLEALAVSNGYAVVRRTDDGGKNWHYSGSGYSGGRVVNMAFRPNGEFILALTDHGLWESALGGKYFTRITSPKNGGYSIGDVALSSSTILASIGSWSDKTLYISNDNGTSWSRKGDINGAINFIRFHPQDSNVIYAGHFRSDDAGNNWKDVTYDLSEVSSINGNMVYGIDRADGTVMLSTNRGDTWKTIPGAPIGITINDLALNASEDHLYVAYAAGVYVFNGSNWANNGEQSGLLKDVHGMNYYKFVQADPKNDAIVYAAKAAPGKGVSNGVFRSTDNGLTWEPYVNGLSGDLNVWGMSASPIDGTIYLGTTTGLYQLK